MGGYTYGDEPPTEKCPYCSEPCEADFVDIGVGFQQCGPYHCLNCGASEIGPHDAPRELTEDEKKHRWYAPGKPPSEHANMLDGRIVSHRQMEAAYKAEFTGNPAWEEDGAVDDWREKNRLRLDPSEERARFGG